MTGIINIGSNSAKLLLPNGGLGYRETVTCQLAKGQKSGILDRDSIGRTLEAVRSLCALAGKRGAKEILVYATEAVRSAANAAEVVSGIEAVAGTKVEILDGETEALCCVLGAGAFFPTLDALIDIGGASTEVAFAEKGGIFDTEYLSGGNKENTASGAAKDSLTKTDNSGAVRSGIFNGSPLFFADGVSTAEISRVAERIQKISIPVGAVRLTDACGQSYRALYEAALRAVEGVPTKPCKLIVGASGTFCSLAAADMKLEIYENADVHAHVLTRERLAAIASEIEPLTPEEICALFPAVGIKRANVLKAGLAILSSLLTKFTGGDVCVSAADGLNGYAILKGAR